MWRGWYNILDMTITGWDQWLWGGGGCEVEHGEPSRWQAVLPPDCRGAYTTLHVAEQWWVMASTHSTSPSGFLILTPCYSSARRRRGEQGEGPETLSTIFATPCYPTTCFQTTKCFTFSRVDLESDPYSLWTLWFEIVYLQTTLNEEHSFARIYWSNMFDCLTSQLSQKYNFQRDQKYW